MTPCWINFNDLSQGGGECRYRYGIAVAFVTTKRRESFLSRMVPSVTDAQKRKLLSDPLFHQKDLFTPATIEATLQMAGDVVHLGDGPTISPSGSFGHSSRQGSVTPPCKRRMLSDDSSADERFAAANAGPSVSWRQPYAFAPDQPTSNSSGRSFHQGGGDSPPPPSSNA